MVVAGDFNDWHTRASSLLKRCASLREVVLDVKGREARTFPVRWPLLRLDRIYVRNARVLHSQILSDLPWSKLSDHAGLTADVQLS